MVIVNASVACVHYCLIEHNLIFSVYYMCIFLTVSLVLPARRINSYITYRLLRSRVPGRRLMHRLVKRRIELLR